MELLKKYRLSYKADIEDVTDSMGLFHIAGPFAAELLKKLTGTECEGMEEYDHLSASLDGQSIKLVKIKRTVSVGYDIYADAHVSASVWDSLLSSGQELGIVPIGFEALNILRVEAGIPVFGVDMDESNIPIEAGLWDALDFEKGCYVGQEVVARIKWRGHVNWHLLGFSVAGEQVPTAGDEVYSDERKVGRITSGVYSPYFKKPLALGYIRREFKDPGTAVSIKSGEDSLSDAVVAETPF